MQKYIKNRVVSFPEGPRNENSIFVSRLIDTHSVYKRKKKRKKEPITRFIPT